ncbi:heparin-binding hemagglutinin [Nocardia asteroides]|uniref:heparin-binding hemagglutinin n=1 Tax=Nocardia asteroides TaxID=1824 RepID=UPI001E53E6F6|nr:heparin-binding hemagglutinin [Nocardia asteroides]UGT64687.1 heparin-binding hemagglutinin [Nocardia asteroides]
MTEKNATVTKTVFATVGAGDAVYTAVLDAVGQVRERAVTTDVQSKVGEARERLTKTEVQAQFDSLRERLSGLPSELPEDLAALREKFTPEELRRIAEQYYRQALDIYADLASRGEETVDRLRTNQVVDERIQRVETIYNDTVKSAEGVVGRVSDLLGRQAKAAEEKAAEVVDAAPVVEAEVVAVATEVAPTEGQAAAPKKKPAPRKKATTEEA